MDKEKQTKTKTKTKIKTKIKTKNRKTERQTDKRDKRELYPKPPTIQPSIHPSTQPSIHPAIRPGCVCVYVWKSREQRATYIHTYIQARPYQRTSDQLKSSQIVAPFSSLLSHPILFFTQERHGMDTTHSKEPRALLCF